MSEKFHGIVNFNEAGEVVCFCSYEEYLRGKCFCRETKDCPEAMIEITVMPNSKPSDKGIQKIKKAQKETSNALKKATEQTNRIKQGVTRLEKAIKGSRFRI